MAGIPPFKRMGLEVIIEDNVNRYTLCVLVATRDMNKEKVLIAKVIGTAR